MTANELRIGNIIDLHIESADRWVNERIVSANDIECIAGGFTAQGIHLTEEWLLKFGFVKIKHVHGYEFWHHKIHKLDWYETKTEWMGYIINHCKFVHQLQNLIFSLTGKELSLEK